MASWQGSSNYYDYNHSNFYQNNFNWDNNNVYNNSAYYLQNDSQNFGHQQIFQTQTQQIQQTHSDFNWQNNEWMQNCLQEETSG